MIDRGDINNLIKKILEDSDKLFDAKDVEGLKNMIDKALAEIENIDDSFDKVQLYYSIATSYSNIYSLEYDNLSTEDREMNLENQIYYFRKAIQNIEIERIIVWNRLDNYSEEKENTESIFELHNVTKEQRQLFSQVFVNLASCYDTIFRTVDALYCYRRALSYMPDFPMALGNWGIGLMLYSCFFSTQHEHALMKYSYIYLKEALKQRKYLEIKNPNAIKMFENYMDDIKSVYSKNLEWLESNIQIEGDYGEDEDEINYKTWVAAKGLFFNPLNDVNNLPFSINDILHLPDMIYGIDDDAYKLVGLFNQIKQEYVSTRYLFYISSEGIVDAHYSDRGNILLNTLDYSNESYYDFLQKTCFKSLHSILDRIAFFINDYFQLGIEERQVSFRRIWRDNRDGTNKLKEYIEENFALNGLFWLAKDVHQENYNTIKPEMFDYKDFRNYLEHKYVKILKEIFYTGENRTDSLAYYITESELYTANLELLRLVRAIVISLISAIDTNEQMKRKQAEEKGEIIPSISLDAIEDDWKL